MARPVVWRLGVAAAAAAASLCLAPAAKANGKFPFADQVVVDPSNPEHLVVRTSFGLVVSNDGGASWGWVCEDAMGYADYEPGLAVVGSGAIVLGLQAGVTVSAANACGWTAAPEIAAYAPDVSGVRGASDTAVAITSLGGANPAANVWRSVDAGGSWAQFGVDLPEGVLGTTLDVAPSAHSTIYVSGLAGPAGRLSGVLVRSDDDGASWTSFPIPGSDAFEPPYIGAVDPNDPDVVYLRLAGLPGRLLVTKNGGASFEDVFAGNGLLQAFALSPDGETVLVGGSKDGIWRAPKETLEFEKIATIAVRCLSWTAGGVYACGDDFLDGFFIGLSADEGATFTPLLQKACLGGPIECDAATVVGSTCAGLWPSISQQLDAVPCTLASGAGGGASGGPTSGAGGGSSGPGAGGSMDGGAGGASTKAMPDESDGGCSCRTTPGREERALAWLGVLALILAGCTRGRRRIRRRTDRRTSRRCTPS